MTVSGVAMELYKRSQIIQMKAGRQMHPLLSFEMSVVDM